RARFALAYSSAQEVKNRVTDYVISNEEWPQSLQALGYERDVIEDKEKNIQIGIYNNGLVGAKVGVDETGEEKYIVLEPTLTEGNISWECYGENVLIKYLPKPCQ